MTKYYEHKTYGHFVSSVTIEKSGLNVEEYVEYVRCRDGILRRIDSVESDNRFVGRSDNVIDFDVE